MVPASAITAPILSSHPGTSGFRRGLDIALAPEGVFVLEAINLIDILDQALSTPSIMNMFPIGRSARCKGFLS